MATSVDCMKTEDYIAHMIDVIKPFLVKHVKCLHLLPFLPFMRGHAGKILKLERSGDLAGASELFLKCLQECDSEPGRYAAFRDALHEADYDHVASVLEGGDMEENHQEHCKLIEIFTSSIIDKMDPIEMVRLLRQHDLLTDSDENEIRNIHREHSRYDAALYLLDCVHRRKLGWYDKFMSTMLEIYPELVQLVDPHFKEKKERQNSSKKSEETFTESIEELTLSVEGEACKTLEDMAVDSSCSDLTLEQVVPKRLFTSTSASQELPHFENSHNNLDKNTHISVQPLSETEVKEVQSPGDTSNEDGLMLPTSAIHPQSLRGVVKSLALRPYQEELARTALSGENTIICAPTNSGKTFVAAKIMKEHLEKSGIRKIVFFANQVVLVEQQYNVIKDFMPVDCNILQLSGENQDSYNVPLKELVMRNDILFMTPQILVDAFRDGEVSSVSEFTLLVFDECHHTNLDHPFNQIMFHYMDVKLDLSRADDRKFLPQIVGLTASLGVGKAKTQPRAVDHIRHLCAHLDARGGVSTVQEHQEDLAKYIRTATVDVVKTKQREEDIFQRVISDSLMAAIERMLLFPENTRNTSPMFVKDFLHPPVERGRDVYTQWVSNLKRGVAEIEDQTARRFYFTCRRMLELYNKALILNDDCRTKDALKYLEGELEDLYYTIRMNDTDKLLKEQFEKVMPVLKDASYNPLCVNPKLTSLCAMITETFEKESGSRCMVFVKTRNLAVALKNWMEEDPNLSHLKPGIFIGQTASVEKGGMTRNQQVDAAELFRKGGHKIIIATSVAEEGMDFSKCNLVIKYEYVTNEIAMVQARGRARAEDSQFVVVTDNKHGTAEKEELNMIREAMMNQALIQLDTEITNNPRQFQADILIIQQKEKQERDHIARNKSQRDLTEDEYELRCMKCNNLACFSTDLRTIKSTTRVVIGQMFKTKIIVQPHPKPCKMGPSMQKKYKIFCKTCGLSWGIAIIYRDRVFPVINIASLIAVDGMGVTSGCLKKWTDVHFMVHEITSDELSSYTSLETDPKHYLLDILCLTSEALSE